jgi:hypothetical protein
VPFFFLKSEINYIFTIVAPKKIEAKEIIQEVKDVVPPPRAPPKEPPTFEFMTDMPAISAQDLYVAIFSFINLLIPFLNLTFKPFQGHFEIDSSIRST